MNGKPLKSKTRSSFLAESILLPLLAMVMPVTFAAPEFQVRAVRLDTPPRIDGKLDEDSWDTAADDGSSAYYFGPSLLGTQFDGTVDDKWDAAWENASVRDESGWTAEAGFPSRY